ncbi:MAG: hypothetical protein QGH33_02620 [Pirellulaceae bacterium]|nr:hypothetical protein [Pirellulaceae bacterium]
MATGIELLIEKNERLEMVNGKLVVALKTVRDAIIEAPNPNGAMVLLAQKDYDWLRHALEAITESEKL